VSPQKRATPNLRPYQARESSGAVKPPRDWGSLVMSPVERLVHPDQGLMPEWGGAGVCLTSDLAREPNDAREDGHLLVQTRHAKPLTWLFFELRDAFGGWLAAGNQDGFFGVLARVALDHLAAHHPEPADAKPLLRAVLDEAFRWQEILRREGKLPNQPAVIIHQKDAGDRQGGSTPAGDSSSA
jgi:hypothetical protein